MPQTMPAQRRGKGICGCFGSNEPPEITYHVVENGGIINLQPHPLTPTQPMPDEEELNSKFAELVVSIIHFLFTMLNICILHIDLKRINIHF